MVLRKPDPKLLALVTEYNRGYEDGRNDGVMSVKMDKDRDTIHSCPICGNRHPPPGLDY